MQGDREKRLIELNRRLTEEQKKSARHEADIIWRDSFALVAGKSKKY